MRIRFSFFLACLAVLMLAITVHARGDLAHNASAVLKDANGTRVGLATFAEDGNGIVHINVNVSGLPPGTHGIHIHEKGDCTGPGFTSAGEHYNPLGKQHGLNNPQGPHAGDLPNLAVDRDGKGQMSITTERVTVSDGPVTLFDRDGSAIVIHAGPDDQVSNPSGNSGGRIACGVIEKE